METLFKIKWYGFNKTLKKVLVSSPLTTTDIIIGNYDSFFCLSNRDKSGNCKFLAEVRNAGIQDKKKNDIFEGDILKYTKRGHPEYISRVKWDEEMCTFEFFEEGYMKGLPGLVQSSTPMTWPDKMEIIGNIYQNPELLKK